MQNESAMHEDFSRPEEINRSSDRSFGFVIAAVFAVVGLLPLFHSPPTLRWWALAVALAVAGCALFWTAPLAPLARLWFRFGLLLATIVSPIVLALLFYIAILPIGLLMRIFGKSPSAFEGKRDGDSYWIRRDPAGPPPATMKHQF
jgi:hypothetical protein